MERLLARPSRRPGRGRGASSSASAPANLEPAEIAMRQAAVAHLVGESRVTFSPRHFAREMLALRRRRASTVCRTGGGSAMSDRNKLLSAALVVFGAAVCLVYPLAMLWPSGWAWHEGSPAASDYFLMIVGVYATLGIFMIRAAKDPAANASLIWFVVWSSVVHAGVMAWEAMRNPMMQGHLIGDVPILLFVAIVLGLSMSRAGTRATVAV
jgi:hypothetical protein